MKVEILSYKDRPVQSIELMQLYHDAGWWPQRNLQDLEEMLQREFSLGVWQDERLIGFARAVTDGKFRAYVEDVVIHSDFKRIGLGNQLMGKLMEELAHIDVVSLFCDEELLSFYEKNGFKQSSSQFVLHRK